MNPYQRIYESIINEIGDTPDTRHAIMQKLQKRKKQLDLLRSTGLDTPAAERAAHHAERQIQRVGHKILPRHIPAPEDVDSPRGDDLERGKWYRPDRDRPSPLIRGGGGGVGKMMSSALSQAAAQKYPSAGPRTVKGRK